mmetsp:Transcript_74706/g.213991  ORF Transcript_74706/g.213991 Transcript_74706/m.213991 type:complete len:203 (-) Transcript_74706:2-610(-)
MGTWYSEADAHHVLAEGMHALAAVPHRLRRVLRLVEHADHHRADRSDVDHDTLLRTTGDGDLDGRAVNVVLLLSSEGVLLASDPKALCRALSLSDRLQDCRLVDCFLLLGAILLCEHLLVGLLEEQAPALLGGNRGGGVHGAISHTGERPCHAVPLGEEPLLNGRVPVSLLLGHGWTCEKRFWKRTNGALAGTPARSLGRKT